MKRDGFIVPYNDYELIEKSRIRLEKKVLIFNRTEIIRLALNALNRLDDSELKEIAKGLFRMKSGRPSRAHDAVKEVSNG